MDVGVKEGVAVMEDAGESGDAVAPCDNYPYCDIHDDNNGDDNARNNSDHDNNACADGELEVKTGLAD